MEKGSDGKVRWGGERMVEKGKKWKRRNDRLVGKSRINTIKGLRKGGMVEKGREGKERGNKYSWLSENEKRMGEGRYWCRREG